MTFARELTRKALHVVFAGVPVALAAGAPSDIVLAILGGMLAVAVVLEVARRRSAAVATTFTRMVGPLLREEESDRWTGATWLILVCLAAVWMLPRADAIAVTWAAAVGDASAALVGIPLGGRLVRLGHGNYGNYGNHGKHGKSIEGSAACFLVTLAGAYGLAGLSARVALLVAAAATAAEWPRSAVDDNVRVGAATTAVLILVNFRLHG
jgi:dolichol kinase